MLSAANECGCGGSAAVVYVFVTYQSYLNIFLFNSQIQSETAKTDNLYYIFSLGAINDSFES